jgi:hypothetical protein
MDPIKINKMNFIIFRYYFEEKWSDYKYNVIIILVGVIFTSRACRGNIVKLS